MTIRNLVIPVLALGLGATAMYFSPCLSGDCDRAAVAESDDAKTPCSKGERDEDAAPEALAAVEEEPCHGAAKAEQEEDPCPFAKGDEPCDGKKKAGDEVDPSALAAVEAKAEPEAPTGKTPRS